MPHIGEHENNPDHKLQLVRNEWMKGKTFPREYLPNFVFSIRCLYMFQALVSSIFRIISAYLAYFECLFYLFYMLILLIYKCLNKRAPERTSQGLSRSCWLTPGNLPLSPEYILAELFASILLSEPPDCPVHITSEIPPTTDALCGTKGSYSTIVVISLRRCVDQRKKN